MKLYLLLHTHECGSEVQSVYPFKAYGMPTIEEAVEQLGIDYEPDRGEDIDFMEIDPDNIVVLT